MELWVLISLFSKLEKLPPSDLRQANQPNRPEWLHACMEKNQEEAYQFVSSQSENEQPARERMESDGSCDVLTTARQSPLMLQTASIIPAAVTISPVRWKADEVEEDNSSTRIVRAIMEFGYLWIIPALISEETE
nr:hypothetical protein Iba_chr12eCG12530 [Ipomoea batatas]